MDIRIVEFQRRYKDGQPVDWVQLTNRGAITENGNLTHSTWHIVRTLVPPEGWDPDALKTRHMMAVWSVVGPAYEAWKKGEELPETGTALSAWAGVSAEQVKIFRQFGLATVEDLAAMQDGVMQKIPLPNTRDIRKQAKLYVDGQGSAALSKQVTDLQAQLEAAMEMLAEKEKKGKEKAA